MATHNNRIALITSGTKGVGFEVAYQLASHGIEVLIGSRDESHGEKVAEQLVAKHLPVTYIHLDVTKQTTIDLAVAEIENAYGRLDILINNSGKCMKESRPTDLTIDTFRQIVDINFFSAVSVTKAFLPLIRQSSSGRIVNVSSSLGSFNISEKNQDLNFHCAYSASKAALNMFTLYLANDLKHTKIKVNACASDLTINDSIHHTIENTAKSIFFLATLSDDGPSGKLFGHDCKEIHW